MKKLWCRLVGKKGGEATLSDGEAAEAGEATLSDGEAAVSPWRTAQVWCRGGLPASESGRFSSLALLQERRWASFWIVSDGRCGAGLISSTVTSLA